MSDQKIINLQNYKKQISKKTNFPKKIMEKNKKMLFLLIAIGALLGVILWNYFVEDVANLDVQIPPSRNIAYNEQLPVAMTTTQVANEFEKADGKPILLYIYTTWCKICAKNFATINDISREFQNTDLQIIALAIDRDIEAEILQNYLNKFGEFYFQPRYLAFKEGFIDFLTKKNIRYNNHVPFTVLISKEGKVLVKYSGAKNKNYLRNKIVKELYL